MEWTMLLVLQCFLRFVCKHIFAYKECALVFVFDLQICIRPTNWHWHTHGRGQLVTSKKDIRFVRCDERTLFARPTRYVSRVARVHRVRIRCLHGNVTYTRSDYYCTDNRLVTTAGVSKRRRSVRAHAVTSDAFSAAPTRSSRPACASSYVERPYRI